ncbi:DNA alkylation repair protein [Filimonas effusa]|uniref:HEAT repeat domain-containing protein n=1 Tax=Filimonas effusa TaxID=2508721 RepID=A0A4Q1D984_9BACT|nr:DNA alkylation repair protein [Filimonas effusa]RXK85388.1 HEAT repeat domain-containing protein [Filimonas effusa]
MQEQFNHLLSTVHGFKAIESEALKITSSHSIAASEQLAEACLQSEHYQIRSLGVFILGFIAGAQTPVLSTLKKVSLDESWQVQEILAKAFDQYCKDTGYEQSLPAIKSWLGDKNANVCRAVVEGLRIWTGRPYFKAHPLVAIQLISKHKAHESEYLRKSVGNALRDIGKKHKALVEAEVATWDRSDKRINFTYKLVVKNWE